MPSTRKAAPQDMAGTPIAREDFHRPMELNCIDRDCIEVEP